MKCCRNDCDGEATHYWINSNNDPVCHCEECAVRIHRIYEFPIYPVTPLIEIHRICWQWFEDTKTLGKPHPNLVKILELARNSMIVISKELSIKSICGEGEK